MFPRGAAKKDTFLQTHIKTAKENTDFHKSVALRRLRDEEACRKKGDSFDKNEEKNKCREMDEKEEETERMREWHVIMKSRGRRAVAAHPSTASDRILSLSFTLFFSLSISPLCLSACICHKSGGSKTVGCEKMMALTFYWQKIYIHYSSINTIPLHTPIQPVTQHLNTGCVVVCIFVSS